MLHIQSRTKLSETTMSDSAGFREKKKSQDPGIREKMVRLYEAPNMRL